MKHILIHTLILITLNASISAQNLLENGGFEINNGMVSKFGSPGLSINPWVIYGGEGGFIHNDYLGHNNSAWSVKLFDNHETYLTQDFAATAGRQYFVSGYTFVASNDPLEGKEAYVKLEWYSDTDGGLQISSDIVAVLTSYTPLDRWVRFDGNANAPAGTIMGRLTILTKDTTNVNAAGSAGFDDLSVSLNFID